MDRWFLQGWRFRPSTHPPHGFGRLGAFVDGVYAIAATLLVLELRLPEEVPAGQLGSALRALGPQYAAYAIGLLQLVGGWLQSRRMESWMRGVDHYATLLILGANGIFSLTPFTTQVLSRAFGDVGDLGTAVRLSAALLFVASALYSALLVYARRTGMFRPDLDPAVFTLYFHIGSRSRGRRTAPRPPRASTSPARPARRSSARAAAPGAAGHRRARGPTSPRATPSSASAGSATAGSRHRSPSRGWRTSTCCSASGPSSYT